MKYYILLFSIAALIPFTICNAKTKKQAEKEEIEWPYYELVDPPFFYDTETDFTATGFIEGPTNQKRELHNNALLSAREVIRLKMKRSYQEMVSAYFASMGNNECNDIERKIELAGDSVINQIINDLKSVYEKWTGVDSNGYVSCYTVVVVSKKEVAKQISQEVEENLSQEEKDRIGFNEQEYSKQLEMSFKQYKERK